MVACNTCLSLYLERMLVRPVSLSLFYRAAQRGASRAPRLALSLSLERLCLWKDETEMTSDAGARSPRPIVFRHQSYFLFLVFDASHPHDKTCHHWVCIYFLLNIIYFIMVQLF